MNLRTPEEISLLRDANQLVRAALDAVAAEIAPGVTTGHLNAVAESVLSAAAADPLFVGQRMPNVTLPFAAATCVSVNEEIIHGVPGDRELLEGDIVSVDCGARLAGWCGDSARTWAVGSADRASMRLMDTTREALDIAISEIRPGRKWSEIARRIQALAERSGFGVVRDFGGHGVGRELHEPPHVPNYSDDMFRRKGPPDFTLQPGLVIAVEPMLTAGTYRTEQSAPGEWPIVTRDRRRSAHFEHTLAVTDTGADVLSAY